MIERSPLQPQNSGLPYQTNTAFAHLGLLQISNLFVLGLKALLHEIIFSASLQPAMQYYKLLLLFSQIATQLILCLRYIRGLSQKKNWRDRNCVFFALFSCSWILCTPLTIEVLSEWIVFFKDFDVKVEISHNSSLALCRFCLVHLYSLLHRHCRSLGYLTIPSSGYLSPCFPPYWIFRALTLILSFDWLFRPHAPYLRQYVAKQVAGDLLHGATGFATLPIFGCVASCRNKVSHAQFLPQLTSQ